MEHTCFDNTEPPTVEEKEAGEAIRLNTYADTELGATGVSRGVTRVSHSVTAAWQ